ncbi:MAG TPA: hypothetical protein DCM08_01400 [Microscillaceae bacterium]|nr:hypothetical protein [Microscillaceae bacterium]
MAPFDYILLFGLSSASAYWLMVWNKYQSLKVHPQNIGQYLQNLKIRQDWLDEHSENELSMLLAQQLRKRFGQPVNTQVRIQATQTDKTRIDIDVAEGKVGIEVKLSKSLQSANERNRLLGQVELYKEKKYNQQNLILVVVGKRHLAENHFLQDIKALLNKKKINFVYLQTI